MITLRPTEACTSQTTKAVVDLLASIAQRKGASPGQFALAWLGLAWLLAQKLRGGRENEAQEQMTNL